MTEMEKTFILKIPEEILVLIFSYLNISDLYQLSNTCEFIKSIIECNLNLWKCIDAREGHNSNTKTEYCINRVNNKTTHICVRGNEEGYGQIPKNFLSIVIALKNLKIIALENQKFNGSQVRLKDFPKCLEELCIKNSLIKRPRYFFRGSDQNMQKLRVSFNSRWLPVDAYNLLQLDNEYEYEKLEILSAANCMNGKVFVTYLWDKYKSNNLKVVDFRFSIVIYCDDLKVAWKPLHAVYFQNVSYTESDYGVKIAYKINRTYENIGVYSDFECDISETIDKYKWELFGKDEAETMPVSYLYKDPYSECTCGYKEREGSGLSKKKSTVNYGEIFTAFHKEAMEVDWDSASTDHSEQGYGASDDEFEDNSDKDQPNKLAIQRVSLRGFEDVNNESLRCIKRVGLEVLDLTGTSVTKEGIEDFLSYNPNCRIVHPLYCVCKPRSPF